MKIQLIEIKSHFSLLQKSYCRVGSLLTKKGSDIIRIIDGVNNNNLEVIFCESTVNNDPAKQVARETSANYGGFLYVDSLSKSDGPVPTYLELLRVTSETILLGLLGNKK